MGKLTVVVEVVDDNDKIVKTGFYAFVSCEGIIIQHFDELAKLNKKGISGEKIIETITAIDQDCKRNKGITAFPDEKVQKKIEKNKNYKIKTIETSDKKITYSEDEEESKKVSKKILKRMYESLKI